jgi:alkanesulfonate monooxygenase SsuD/methylene tetrahydromethanopterin reductase-like flavin-dependent oxidoreductase (luciferase family)
MSGRSQLHLSTQRTPVLCQAGTFKYGAAFASKHAEAIFLNCVKASQDKEINVDMHSAAIINGRDPQSLKFFPCSMPITGKDAEDAKHKLNTAKKYADPVASLAQFSRINLSTFTLDEPMDLSKMSQVMAIQAVVRALEASEGEEKQLWAPRRLGMRMALGILYPCPVGTAGEVEDVIRSGSKKRMSMGVILGV